MQHPVGVPKMSEVLVRAAKLSLRDQESPPSAEAAHAALLLAHAGWNRALGYGARGYDVLLDKFVESRPELWSELRSSDPQVLVAAAAEAKVRLYPDDRRVVLVCGIRDDRVHVEWCDSKDYPEAVRRLKRRPGLVRRTRNRSDRHGA